MKRFKNILCVISTDIDVNGALEHAVKLAENNQASLTIIEVIDEIPPNTKLFERTLSPVNLQEKILTEHKKKLEEVVFPFTEKIKIKSKVLTGILFIEVIHEVLRNGYDLVLKTAESDGLLSRVFSSNDMHLLRKCPCPVWLVKPKAPLAYRRILAAVDVNDSYPSDELNTRYLLNHQILEMATSLALSESAELYIVHVWNAVGEGAMRHGFIHKSEAEVNTYVEEIRQHQCRNLNTLINELYDKFGRGYLEYLKPKQHLLKGYPRKSVPEFAMKIQADLMVMGTVARTGLPGFFMGNTAESIFNQLDCSVLAVKPTGFVTPVTLDE